MNTALRANAAIFVCKICAYGVTGSSAMLAEAVHSVADIVNQALLRYGINSSTKAPDEKFNYGYRRERFVWSLISAVGPVRCCPPRHRSALVELSVSYDVASNICQAHCPPRHPRAV